MNWKNNTKLKSGWALLQFILLVFSELLSFSLFSPYISFRAAKVNVLPESFKNV